MIPLFLKIKEPTGANYQGTVEDNLNVKRALKKTGHYKHKKSQEWNGFPTRTMVNAIKKYQTDHRLKVDGFLSPGGIRG